MFQEVKRAVSGVKFFPIWSISELMLQLVDDTRSLSDQNNSGTSENHEAKQTDVKAA